MLRIVSESKKAKAKAEAARKEQESQAARQGSAGFAGEGDSDWETFGEPAKAPVRKAQSSGKPSILDQLNEIDFEGMSLEQEPEPLPVLQTMKVYKDLDAAFEERAKAPKFEDTDISGLLAAEKQSENGYSGKLVFSRDNLLNGIVFSEVLSAPKARR